VFHTLLSSVRRFSGSDSIGKVARENYAQLFGFIGYAEIGSAWYRVVDFDEVRAATVRSATEKLSPLLRV